ncbi:YhbD family protein [Paenibacillus chitinolyticus]|uniref:YhbD family protein n=1 Tax=Paenibacillus chitinolyticus TaxID=79263 RepID=UPI00386DB3CB
MTQELISKKDLLELTGISYGQLYRWKRKNLIPEAWFIRKSTFTGQETFFPKREILVRIDNILHKKDDLSLDELADRFSPRPSDLSMTKEELILHNIVSKVALDYFVRLSGDAEVWTFERIFAVYVLHTLLESGEISLEEGSGLIQLMTDQYPDMSDGDGELLFIRKMGVSTCFLKQGTGDIYLEKGVKVVARLQLSSSVEALKTKIWQGA